ncbi:hypothetical protein RFI_19309 [Reticulomyxa filosa]|uniref:Uncharacterized protein n=1 Tax=Reticulomyxa filosa TaxID=46433 RepID=X6MWH9_RETFI|nr:hypothetical protein RFI_19309 [Reticulomyxa filosa]|eukprot:ETO17986.1 hypothetical protein RFI_19309 [Reticulomyxa filosa]
MQVAQYRKDIEKRNAAMAEIFQLMLHKGCKDDTFLKECVQSSLRYRRPPITVMQQFSALSRFDGKPHLAHFGKNFAKQANTTDDDSNNDAFVLVIHGTNDNVLDFRNSVYIHKQLPGNCSRLVLLDDEGHLVHYTQKGLSAIINALKNFDSKCCSKKDSCTCHIEKGALHLLAKM